MHTSKKTLILINILGGLAVLGSYAWGFLTYPNAGEVLWGGVPANLKPLYTASMFLAAAGYFTFSAFILRMQPEATRIVKRQGYPLFNSLYAVILVASALWLPLTILAFGLMSQSITWLVKLDLAAVALASLGLLYALIKVEPHKPAWLHPMAILGCVLFCFQTVILDALIWAINFHL
jgi:hypothetical protein